MMVRDVMVVKDAEAANSVNSLLFEPQYTPGFAAAVTRTTSAPDIAIGFPIPPSMALPEAAV